MASFSPMRLTHEGLTVLGRAEIAATPVNPYPPSWEWPQYPPSVGMVPISPDQDQGETRNSARAAILKLLREGRQCLLRPTQSRNFTMYDGSETVRTKDRVTLGAKPEPPRPLARELPPADLFPIDALGPLLRDAA